MKSVKLPPSKVRVEAIKDLQRRGLELSPESLLKRSRQKTAPLYSHFKQYTDAEMADFGRYEHCRRIIQAVPTYEIIGGKKIEHRMVECVKVDGEYRWALMDDILSDPDMTDAYYRAVQSLLDQAKDKLDILQKLQLSRSKGKAA